MGKNLQVTNLMAASPANKAGLKASGMLNTEQKMEDVFAQQLNHLLAMYSKKIKYHKNQDAINDSNSDQLSQETGTPGNTVETHSGTEKNSDQNKTSVPNARELFLNNILHRTGQKSGNENHGNELNALPNYKKPTVPGSKKTDHVHDPKPFIPKKQHHSHQSKPGGNIDQTDDLKAKYVAGKKMKRTGEKAARAPGMRQVREIGKNANEMITAPDDKHKGTARDESGKAKVPGANKSAKKGIKISAKNSIATTQKTSGKKFHSEANAFGLKVGMKILIKDKKISLPAGSKLESTRIKVSGEKRAVPADQKPRLTGNAHRPDKPAEQSEKGKVKSFEKRVAASDSNKFAIRRHIELGTDHEGNIKQKDKIADKAKFTRFNRSDHYFQNNKTVSKTQPSGSSNEKMMTLDAELVQNGKPELDSEKKQNQTDEGKVTSSGKIPISIHTPNNSGVSAGISKKLVSFVQKQVMNGNAADRAEQWQRHKFILDDGQHLNVSVRQMDGVLKLHIGAGNAEINRILHQHLQEIKHHLQENFQLEIDLQLQNQSQQQDQQHPHEMLTPESLGEGGNSSSVSPTESIKINGSAIVRSRTRLLGFNRNEWTA